MNTKPLRKSGSFLLKKTPSMELQTSLPYSETYVPKKPFNSIEFPSSPPPNQGEEILHSSHPHSLKEVETPDPFTCSGCKERGAGRRFACQQCDFQLHDFCAFSPPSLKNHHFHGHHQLLIFHSKSKPGGIMWSKCDVCGKATRGFTFRCNACSFQMHPCCAMLLTEMNFMSHPHTLRLLPASTLSNGESGFACGECKRKRSGRVYHCTVCDYHLHAVCAKNMINGLQAYGIKGSAESSSMLGIAARFASHVVVGFIEGIGEGLGQALIQSVAKHKGGSKRRVE
ncbi:protein VACUOLELESS GAMETOPHYTES-like isoform X2 [Cornus florida]|uniref:protein VACUOLELESS GAMETOPHYTES-like isoform X2 n=1 Tax=Cornus florida TaxID=4283 RepID=UPI00289C8D35|nr:protein VACUOLELESS GAMETOPHYTES-like isoform X2 [Cornus florida]